MSLAYIVAQAPWGPIRIAAADSFAAMARQITTQPAHVEPCDGIDAAEVVEAARKALPTPDGDGWIKARVQDAVGTLQAAKKGMAAKGVAATPKIATHGAATARETAMVLADAPTERSPAKAQEPVRRPRRASADVDVRSIRTGTGLSQPAFAAAFGLPLATLRDWEQGRNVPDAAARTLLMVIAHRPDAVRAAVTRG